MNKKYALVSIVLIALMSLTLIPVGTYAFHTPSSTDDSQYDQFGPRPSQLLISIYTDYTAELAAFKAKAIDIMDWGLEPIDYAWFEENDELHEQYGTAFYQEFGLYEWDLNDQVLPTSVISFRQALSFMLDKQYFIDTYLPGAGIVADSPIASITGWYNYHLDNLYNRQPRHTMLPIPDDPLDWEMAWLALVADFGPPIVDPEDPAYFTWTWPTPYPDWDPDHVYPPVANGHLLVYARSEMVPRTQQGYYFETCCMTAAPAIWPTLGHVNARIHVDLYVVPRAVTSVQVMSYYRFHAYTGGWSLTRDPDFLEFYTTAQCTKPIPQCHNYGAYSNLLYDAEVKALIESLVIGDEYTVCDGVYHAFQAQAIGMGEAMLIPAWTFSGYKAYLANWRGIVNQVGFGSNSWWTFLNAHKVGSVNEDVIRYGWAGDLLSLNIIGAWWLWDYEVLGKIYDGLIFYNPYNVREDIPYLANSWTQGTWEPTPGHPATWITFDLREDVWWQDIPFHVRNDVTYDGGDEINGPFRNVLFNPIDVAFSIVYTRDQEYSNAGYLVADVDHCTVNPNWAALWPWDTVTPYWYDLNQTEYPWQSDFLQYNPAEGADEITVYFGVMMPWLGLHRVGGLPMIPYHLWKYVAINGDFCGTPCAEINTWLYDMVYGTGPYILLSREPGVEMTMIPYVEGAVYRGLPPLDNGFFFQPVRPGAVAPSDTAAINGYNIYMADTLQNLLNEEMTVTYWFDYELWWYNKTTDVWQDVGFYGNTAPETIGIAPLSTARCYTKASVLNLYGKKNPYGKLYTWCDWFVIHESFHWEYIWGSYTLSNCATDGYLREYPHPNLPSCMAAYWSDGLLLGGVLWKEFLHLHPGDIAGGTLPGPGGYIDWMDEYHENYLAADGYCDIKDVALIGANWGKTVPPNSDFGKNDVDGRIRRADANCDGLIDIKDVSIVGANWGKSWSVNTHPRDPFDEEAPHPIP